jgi:hypothetical protein
MRVPADASAAVSELTKIHGAIPCIPIRLDAVRALTIMLGNSAALIRGLVGHVQAAQRTGAFNNYAMDSVRDYSMACCVAPELVKDLTDSKTEIEAIMKAALSSLEKDCPTCPTELSATPTTESPLGKPDLESPQKTEA